LNKYQMKPDKNVRESEVTPDQVLAHLAKETRPLSIREMAHAMNLHHHGRRTLPRILAKLERKGQVEEVQGGRFRVTQDGRRPRRTVQKDSTVQNNPRTEGAKPAPQNVATSRPQAPARPARNPAADQAIKQAQARQPVSDPNLVSGRFIAHREGYGFVVPDKPLAKVEGDLYIGRDATGDAMNGDQVMARIERRRADGRAEARIVRVVTRAHDTVVGLFRYGATQNTVLPYDARLPQEIIIAAGDELTPKLREKAVSMNQTAAASRRTRFAELDGAVVNVELTRFPKSGLAPMGKVMEILGRPGDMGVDTEIVIRKHHLPHIFPDAVLEEARALPQSLSEADYRGRRDFRNLPIVTIDGESARDFDDAVFVKLLDNGHYELQVHIADVAHYVKRDAPLDLEAHLRGTSVYFPQRVIPMLPEELSNGICSLNPQVDRLVMSVIMEIDGDGRIGRVELTPGVIRSAERMTYTNVHKVIENDPEMTKRYQNLADEFKRMRDLALILSKRRHNRGSIDFDLPEPIIQFDEHGHTTAIVRSERNIAHRLIEEFMLAANESVAKYLDSRGIGSLHRVHEKPDPKKVMEFEELAKAFGYTLGVPDLMERKITVKHGQTQPASRGGRPVRGRTRAMSVTMPAQEEIDIRPEHYQRLTEKIAGKPEERILSYLMLRSLKQARYAPSLLGHFALATREYTHFTSPIRRYPDLIIHRILKWALENPNAAAPAAAAPAASAPATKQRGNGRLDEGLNQRLGDNDRPSIGPYSQSELDKISSETSEAERRAQDAERELTNWKTAQYMEKHLGEEYDAFITSVQKFGFFVELMDVFVEGLVGIDHLEEYSGGYCQFRERDRVIICEPARRVKTRGGRSEPKVFRMGDKVRVRAERIDPFRHRVEFALVTPAENKNPGATGATGRPQVNRSSSGPQTR
jgi:ribonuclease R